MKSAANKRCCLALGADHSLAFLILGRWYPFHPVTRTAIPPTGHDSIISSSFLFQNLWRESIRIRREVFQSNEETQTWIEDAIIRREEPKILGKQDISRMEAERKRKGSERKTCAASSPDFATNKLNLAASLWLCYSLPTAGSQWVARFDEISKTIITESTLSTPYAKKDCLAAQMRDFSQMILRGFRSLTNPKWGSSRSSSHQIAKLRSWGGKGFQAMNMEEWRRVMRLMMKISFGIYLGTVANVYMGGRIVRTDRLHSPYELWARGSAIYVQVPTIQASWDSLYVFDPA